MPYTASVGVRKNYLENLVYRILIYSDIGFENKKHEPMQNASALLKYVEVI
jgi:hypothetical protein